MVPHTATRESASDYSRRSQRQKSLQHAAHQMHRRRILIAIIAVAAAIAVAVGVASFAYSGSVTGKMALDDSSAKASLVDSASSTDPYYVLIAGTFEDPAQTYDGPDVLMLARLDPASRQVTVISIPSNMIATLSDGSSHFISEAENIGGDGALIDAVSSFAGVDIAHFVKTNATGFKNLVDALGGVEVNVSEEVDDPDAGDIYLPAGTQTLNGAQALTFCRANNYTTANTKRADNQLAFLEALTGKVLGSGGVGQLAQVDSFAGNIQTDFTSDELISLMNTFKGIDTSTIYTGIVPGSTSTDTDGDLCFYASSSSWATMMGNVSAGKDPQAKSAAVSSVVPSDYSVTIKNGASITGAAAACSAKLTAAGYQVGETGNTDSAVYSETLVIYKTDATEPVAEAVVSTLGKGRTVSASIYYTFDTDIEVIIGKDWSL